jgi:PAS domain S-box-containing protein
MVLGFRVVATGDERWAVVRATPLELDGQRFAVSTFHDVTDQVRETQASHASERRYREIVEALPVVAWFALPDGSIAAANARWLEYTGSMAGSGPFERIANVHPGDAAELGSRWAAAQAAIEPFEATLRLRRHDGTDRWHLVRVVPWRGESGTLQGWIGTATDIDDERRASLALIDSEREFRELTDAAPMLVWMSGLAGGRTFFNRGWLEFTGRDLQAEAGDGWLAGVHPADRERYVAAYNAAFRRRERLEIEYRLRRHDGVDRWVLDIGVPRTDADGSLMGFTGSCVDIDERVRATQLARLMADVGMHLDESRDVASTIEAATSVAIPAIADWCLIDLVEPDGSLRRVGAAAGDPELQAIVDRLRDFATPAGSSRPSARAVAERRPIFIPDLRDEAALRVETGGIDALANLVRAAGARSAIVQPLIARGQMIGAMFFVAGPDRSYSRADVGMTTELAVRVALAISNAQMNAAEEEARRTAEAAAERVERLQRLTRSLTSASTRDAVAELVVREGRAALGASGAVIAILQDDHLEPISSDGYAPGLIELFHRIPMTSAVPLAVAARESRPVWLPDIHAAEGDDDRTREIIATTANRSACAVPLIADDITFGTIGLSFAEERPFDEQDRSLIGAYADLCAQALARVALTAIRERLVADLESQRARLEALLQQLPEGLLMAEAPSGAIVMANDRVEEILGIPRSELHHIAGGEAYQGFDTEGRKLRPQDWPLARAVKGETVGYTELELVRADGTHIWVSKRAGPILDREGNVVAGVATITDISEVRRARENRVLLANAGELLGSSLDFEETIRRVAELVVPRTADWCAVDLVDGGGVPRRIAVSHVDPAKIALAKELHERFPPDPDATSGLAAVLRTGTSEMVSDIPPDLIETAARDEDHLAILHALQLRSYMCVPIIAGGEVLGAMTFVSAESGRNFDADDLVFAESLAARAASAIANARLFREALRYKRVLDATLDAVIMFDPVTLRISYANRGAADHLGHPDGGLLGADATVVIEDLDAIGIRGLVAPLVAGTQGSQTVTLSYRRRDGRSIPVEVLFQHVQPPGEQGRIVAIARDIGERLEAQANLRRLAESEHARAAELNAIIRAMGDGLFVCSPDGAITMSNPAAEDLFPIVAEQTFADVLAQLDDPDGEAPELGKAGGPVELRAIEGEERWIELSTFPVVHDDDAGGIETIVMLRDVTAARQRQAIRDTFIGVLSHELRTPVTTIFAGSKVLARDGDHLAEETRREIFSDIVVEAERLHRLVEDVIAMTRFGEDEADVGTEPVLIQRVLPSVVRSEERRWPGISFAIDVPAGLPTAVADPTYVEQVIRNLLSNAAKYGGVGTTVSVRVSSTDDEIIVSIADDGPGFPAEEAERIFELFFRSAKTASSAAGAGIGLFVCARLIRAMGGRIWAAARPDGGAEFTFTLRVMTEDV